LAGKTFMTGGAAPLHFDRDPSPCLSHNGLLIVAPADAQAILAFDSLTGKIVWRQDELPDALNLLGVIYNRLIVAGQRLACLDFETGQMNWVWPDSATAGIRGMGRGLIAGEEIFWPTRNQIYVISALSGAQSRSPIDLAPLAGGANLAAAQDCLVVAGYDRLTVLGSPKQRVQTPATLSDGR